MDTANLLAMGAGINEDRYFELAYAFMKTRGIIIPEGKVKGNRKALKEMVSMNVYGRHVRDATEQLMKAKMTITDLFSVSKTAIALANPAPEETVHSKFEGV